MKINLLIARETAWMLGLRGKCRKVKIKIDGSVSPIVVCKRNQCAKQMPGTHSPDKEPLSLQIPRALMGRLKKQAKAAGKPVSAYVISILHEKTADTVLTSKDYAAITEATAKAERTGKRCSTAFDDTP